MTGDADQSAGQGDDAPWDEELADALRGSYILIGITYLRANGELDSHVQMHGRVTECSQEHGVGVALEGKRAGETYWLPPALDAFQSADRGEYRLRSTGEVVVDPDYTTSWTINRPPSA